MMLCLNHQSLPSILIINVKIESDNYFSQKLGRSLAEFINSFRSAAQIVTISGKFFTLVDIS